MKDMKSLIIRHVIAMDEQVSVQIIVKTSTDEVSMLQLVFE